MGLSGGGGQNRQSGSLLRCRSGEFSEGLAGLAADAVLLDARRVGVTEGGLPHEPSVLVRRKLIPLIALGIVIAAGEDGATGDSHSLLVNDGHSGARRSFSCVLENIDVLGDAVHILLHQHHRW